MVSGMRLEVGRGEVKGDSSDAGGISVGMEEAWSFWRDSQPRRAQPIHSHIAVLTLNSLLNLSASVSLSGEQSDETWLPDYHEAQNKLTGADRST